MSSLIVCTACGDTRTARDACHCGACHRTFSGVGPFDLHRSAAGEHGACLDPSTLINQRTGLPKLQFRDGMWRGYQENVGPASG